LLKKNNMRIAIDSLFLYSSPNTGISVYTNELIKQFSSLENMEVIVFYAGNNKQEIQMIKERLNGVKYQLRQVNLHGRIVRGLWSIIDYPNISKYLKDVDIYHSPFFILLGLSKLQKTVITIHDVFPFQYPHFFPFFTRIAHIQRLKKIKGKICKNNNIHIIVNSNSTQKDVIKLLEIPLERITKIYLGISEVFTGYTKSEQDIKILERHGICKPYILSVGSLNPRKNIKRLIDAFEMNKNAGNFPHKLVLVGTAGWLNQELLSRIKKNQDIIPVGAVPEKDLPIIYGNSNLFVFPSLYEGFGLPIIEAMSCRVPVITSNVSSMPEIADSSAYLINPYDYKDIAKSIKEVLKNHNLRKELIKKGMERSLKFSWNKMAQQTLSVYNKLIES